MIPSIDAAALFDPAHPAHAEAVAEVRRGATEIGFLTLRNTEIIPEEVLEVIATLRAFFHLPAAEKEAYDMACTVRIAGGARRAASRSILRLTPITSRSMIAASSLIPPIPWRRSVFRPMRPTSGPRIPKALPRRCGPITPAPLALR